MLGGFVCRSPSGIGQKGFTLKSRLIRELHSGWGIGEYKSLGGLERNRSSAREAGVLSDSLDFLIERDLVTGQSLRLLKSLQRSSLQGRDTREAGGQRSIRVIISNYGRISWRDRMIFHSIEHEAAEAPCAKRQRS